MQSNQQNMSVPMKEKSGNIEFETSPNSNLFVIWRMNFKSEVCSSSSFPTDAMVGISEIDSARNMDELKSSSSMLGRMIPDFEVLDSKIARYRGRLD